jgi:hypothetical protein
MTSEIHVRLKDGIIFVFMYENRTMKPVEIVLRRREEKK